MTKFVLTQEHRYWWPVKVRMPNGDSRRAGQFVEFQFKAEFRAMLLDEAKDIQERIDALEGTEKAAAQNDFLRRVVVGWDDDIIDDDKQPVPFSPEAFEQVLSHQWALIALWRAWSESLIEDRGRKGN